MPVPVIDHTQSVPGFLQWETFAFQPFAWNTPTGWSASTLPPGLTINATTGKITGAVTVPGIYTVGLVATNGSGDSDAVAFTFGIERSTNVPPSSLVEAVWDLTTGKVTFPGFTDATPVAFKRTDNFVMYVTLKKGGLAADLALTSLKFAIKYEETEDAVVVSDGMRKIGSGLDTAYMLHVQVAGTALESALGDSEGNGDATASLADFATRLAAFIGLGEFEAIETSPYRAGSPTLGLTTLRHSSQTFPVQLIRDIIPS